MRAREALSTRKPRPREISRASICSLQVSFARVPLFSLSAHASAVAAPTRSFAEASAQLKKLNCQSGASSFGAPEFRALTGAAAGTPSTIDGLACTFFAALDGLCFVPGGGVIDQTTERSAIGSAAFAAVFDAIAFSAAAS